MAEQEQAAGVRRRPRWKYTDYTRSLPTELIQKIYESSEGGNPAMREVFPEQLEKHDEPAVRVPHIEHFHLNRQEMQNQDLITVSNSDNLNQIPSNPYRRRDFYFRTTRAEYEASMRRADNETREINTLLGRPIIAGGYPLLPQQRFMSAGYPQLRSRRR